MVKLFFPAVGSTREVPLFEPITRALDEKEETFAERSAEIAQYEGVLVRARMLPRPEAFQLEKAWSAAWSAEQARQLKAKEAGAPIRGFSEEGIAELCECNRAMVRAACAAVPGVVVGTCDLGAEGITAEELVARLEDCELMAAAAQACRRAQKPAPKHLER